MVEDGEISPGWCPVFSEQLLYFFYGRPAYRHNEHAQLRISSRAPVVILLNGDIELEGKRVFPFDSGAYHTRYGEWRHVDMPISDFELPCRCQAPQRHVAEFFGSNENYLDLRGQAPSRSFAGEFEVEVLAELISDNGNRPADDRRVAVELQISQSIPLNSSSVIGLVVPDLLLDAAWFNDWTNTSDCQGVKVMTYPFTPLRTASHYQVTLETICRETLKEIGA